MTRLVSCSCVSLLFFGLAGCKCAPSGDPAQEPESHAPTAAAAQNRTGTLEIRAGSDFPFRVIAADGKEVAEGTCNIHQPEVPPGEYRAVISASGTEVTVGPTTVEVGKKAKLELRGFGTLKVSAVKDFMKFEVKSRAGEVVATGDTNITTVGLPVGAYSVEVDTAPFPTTTIANVEIQNNQQADARVNGFGYITVKASKDFVDYKVLDKEGKEVGRGQTNISSLLLPVGELTVVVGDKKTDLKVVEGDKKDFGVEL